MQHFVLLKVKEAAHSRYIIGAATCRAKQLRTYHFSVIHLAKDKIIKMIGGYRKGSLRGLYVSLPARDERRPAQSPPWSDVTREHLVPGTDGVSISCSH